MGDSGSHCVANMSGPGGGTGVPQIQSDTLKRKRPYLATEHVAFM